MEKGSINSEKLPKIRKKMNKVDENGSIKELERFKQNRLMIEKV